MKIILNDLKKMCENFLKKTLAIQGNEINFHIDYYWSISLNKAYDFAFLDQDFTIGSLIEDWYWLKLILEKKNISTLVDFDRLGNLITFLGQELFRPSEKKIGLFFTIKVADLLSLYIHFLSKAEDAGFESIYIPIDLYKTILPENAVDFSEKTKVASVTQSFIDDWQCLEKRAFEKTLTGKDFERLGRAIKIIGETISREEIARTQAGLNFLFSWYENTEDDDIDAE